MKFERFEKTNLNLITQPETKNDKNSFKKSEMDP
jgi:hypothetical protein